MEILARYIPDRLYCEPEKKPRAQRPAIPIGLSRKSHIIPLFIRRGPPQLVLTIGLFLFLVLRLNSYNVSLLIGYVIILLAITLFTMRHACLHVIVSL